MKITTIKISILITIVVLIGSLRSFAQCGWELQNTGQITGTDLTSVFFIDTLTGWTVGGYPGIIARTIDGGINWTEVYYNENCKIFDVHFVNNNHGWAVGGQDYFSTTGPGLILRSIDGGMTWDTILNSSYNIYSVHFFNEDTGLVAGSNKILKTTNGGVSWQITNTGIDTSYFSHTFSKFQFLNNNMDWAKAFRPGETWVAPPDDFFLKTTDGGNNWGYIDYPQSLLYGGMHDYYFVNEDTACVTYGGLNLNNFEYSIVNRTTDGGNSWENVLSFNGYTSQYTAIHFIDQNRGWILGDWLYTDDGGENWISYTDPSCGMYQHSGNDIFFVNENMGCVVESGDYIWITNSGGLFTGIERPIQGNQNVHSLIVYPNPFSFNSTIDFNLSESELATISIFDISGKRIKTILSEKLPAGDHQINWNAEGLKAGLYFIRLETKDEIKIQKALLIN